MDTVLGRASRAAVNYIADGARSRLALSVPCFTVHVTAVGLWTVGGRAAASPPAHAAATTALERLNLSVKPLP